MMAIEFENPVVAGNTLVREAIVSPDYVPGTSGWAIFADGTAEFNDATIRGAIEAGGGTVLLNSGGVYVRNSERQYDINGTAGFLARNFPDNGSLAQLTVYSEPEDAGGVLVLKQKDSSTPGIEWTTCLIYVDQLGDQPFFSIIGPGQSAPTATEQARLILYGGTQTDDTSRVKLSADVVETSGPTRIGRYWSSVSTITDTTAPGVGATETAVLTIPAATYKAGRTYKVEVNGRFSVDNTTTDPIWRLRKTNTAGQLLCLFGRTPVVKITQENVLSLRQHFTVDPNNDVTASLALTVIGSAATNVRMMGQLGGRTITTEDVSDNSYFPDANVLV